MDSGGERFPEAMLQNQIKWVKSIPSQYGNLHAIAFFHIPSAEFSAVDKFKYTGKETTKTFSSFGGYTISPMQDLQQAYTQYSSVTITGIRGVVFQKQELKNPTHWPYVMEDTLDMPVVDMETG